MKLPYIEVEQDNEDPALIYNVTTKVDGAAGEEWLAWMKEEYIPEMLGTGCFHDAVILQLTEVDDSEGPTFAVQYSSAGRSQYNRFIQLFADDMRRKAEARWGAQIISFGSVLRVVN
ncbi:MAG: DUF4286 family protein [Chitinophagaceae bacterium]